jgi:hypothetical protein
VRERSKGGKRIEREKVSGAAAGVAGGSRRRCRSPDGRRGGAAGAGVEGSSLLGHGWCGRRRMGGGVVVAALLAVSPGWWPACAREGWLDLWRRRGRRSGGAGWRSGAGWWVNVAGEHRGRVLGGCVEKILGGIECLLPLLFLNDGFLFFVCRARCRSLLAYHILIHISSYST